MSHKPAYEVTMWNIYYAETIVLYVAQACIQSVHVKPFLHLSMQIQEAMSARDHLTVVYTEVPSQDGEEGLPSFFCAPYPPVVSANTVCHSLSNKK